MSNQEQYEKAMELACQANDLLVEAIDLLGSDNFIAQDAGISVLTAGLDFQMRCSLAALFYDDKHRKEMIARLKVNLQNMGS